MADMNQLKTETAKEFGIQAENKIPVSRCGKIGGNMVKKMIEAEEKKMIEKR